MFAYAGSSASSAQGPGGATPVPGGNFAAALSYGDVTYAGIGTTSYVCDGKVLAFGHPFFYFPAGTTTWEPTLPMRSRSSAIRSSADTSSPTSPAASVPSTRIGSPGSAHCSETRRRRSRSPRRSPSSAGTVATATTEVLDSEYVPYLSFSHLLSNIDFTRDEIGEGSATRDLDDHRDDGDGTPWTSDQVERLRQRLRHQLLRAISEIEQELYTLFYNRFEDDRVHRPGLRRHVPRRGRAVRRWRTSWCR